MIVELGRGIGDALHGAGYLVARPRLWKYTIAPALVTLFVIVGVVMAGVAAFGAPVAALVAILPGEWAESLVKVLLGILLAIASFSFFFGIAALIAAPFNEMLSEAIEREVTGTPGEKFRFFGFLRDIVVGMLHAVRRVTVYLFVMLALLIVGLVVPVVGAIAAMILGTIATARFASYDAYDAVWARRRWKYRAKVEELRRIRWRSLGLGACVALGMLVPGVNLVVLSIGAASATLASLDSSKRSPKSQPRQVTARRAKA